MACSENWHPSWCSCSCFLLRPRKRNRQRLPGTVIDLAVEYMATSAVFRLSNTPAGCPLVAGAYWLQFSPSSTDEVKGCVRGPACGRVERTLRTPRSQRNDAIGYVQRHWIHAQ